MADSFFGFDTSAANLNDDEGGGEGSEEEYDALNDETFGHENNEFDWEVEHEQLAHQLESSRRHDGIDDLANLQLEATLSQLVLDETDAPHHALGSSVWRHDPPPQPPKQHQLKNVCTVEEIERQLRQKSLPPNQTYFQPRYPVILQRPHGIPGPLPLPYAQQPMNHMNQMGQPLNNMMGQNMVNHVNQMGQNMNHMSQNLNQMGPNVNQMGPNVNQMGQNVNQIGSNLNQNVNQLMQNSQLGFQNNLHLNMHQNQLMQNQIMNNMSKNPNHMGQNHIQHNINYMNQSVNHIGQNNIGHTINQISKKMNQMGPNMNQMGQNLNQIGQNMNQMASNVNQMGPNLNQMAPIMNQMINGGQFPMNQFPHMMGQTRIMGPPPGMNMPRQNFSPNMGQYNPNFRGPIPKPIEQPIMMNQQMMMKNQPIIPNQQSLPQTLPQNHSPQKLKEKQRKVYNSKTPNNTSTTPRSTQGLVQLIQNTHPMLQPYNNITNSYHNHNANRYSMANHSQHFVNHTRMHRNGYSDNGMLMNGEDGEIDEYAGLMTQREKQWLMNIQMLQLNTGTPYIHDFYYTVFLERQAMKEKEGIKEAHKANQQNHPFYSGGVKQENIRRERLNSNRHNSTSEDQPRTYVPTQFENSLGKLQCGSVTAPRKIIDLEVVGGEQPPQRNTRAPSVASTTNPAEVPRELKRTKQLLLDIEGLYLILLRVEELNDPLAISNALILKEREEKHKQLEQAASENHEDDTNIFLRNIESVQHKKRDSPKSEVVDKRQVVSLALPQKPAPAKNLLDEDKGDLMNKIFLGLLHSDRLAQMLTVRKGRSLVVRFIARVPPTHQRLRMLWCRIMRVLPAATRKHDTSSLTPCAKYFAKYIENSTGWTAVLEICNLLGEAFDPARTPHVLSNPFTLSCVCVLVERAITLVNTPEATTNERIWFKFLKTLAMALKHTSVQVARPIQPLTEQKLSHHLRHVTSRGTVEILQRGMAHDFADLTNTDINQLLITHLC